MLDKAKADSDLMIDVYQSIEHLMQEREVLDAKIKNYLWKNKNIFYIKNNLRAKKFETNMIQELLEENVDISKSVLSESFIVKKIQNYISKNKSKNYIKNTLIERKEDREVVENMLEKLYTRDIEYKIIYARREKIWNLDSQKLIKKLIWEGFSYEVIQELIF